MSYEIGLCALSGGKVMCNRCQPARSIVLPPIILSKVIYGRLFLRGTVAEATCRVRAHIQPNINQQTMLLLETLLRIFGVSF